MSIVQHTSPPTEKLVSWNGNREPFLKHLALVGNSVPRRCGIATFTTDCHHAIDRRYPGTRVDVYAVDDRQEGYVYPTEVVGTIAQHILQDYVMAGRKIERSGARLLWLQHEFGIFGGAAGAHVFALLDEVTMPIVVTLHTVLAAPNDDQRAVMQGLIDRVASFVVMAQYGRQLLVDVYGADPMRIEVVPHGIPDRQFQDAVIVRERQGYDDGPVVMTFGLLSPNKGIEHMIDALPAIVRSFPNLNYLIVGATHPHLVANQGEAYRESLKSRAEGLGVGSHLRWIDAYLETEDLLDVLGGAEIYVTPYLDPGQVTSGTLAYAVGLGKAVVSTPYIHAREILAEERGRLVPFGDVAALAEQVTDMLSHPEERLAMRRRAYAFGRTMTWSQVAASMMGVFRRAIGQRGVSMASSLVEGRGGQPLRAPSVAGTEGGRPPLTTYQKARSHGNDLCATTDLGA